MTEKKELPTISSKQQGNLFTHKNPCLSTQREQLPCALQLVVLLITVNFKWWTDRRCHNNMAHLSSWDWRYLLISLAAQSDANMHISSTVLLCHHSCVPEEPLLLYHSLTCRRWGNAFSFAAVVSGCVWVKVQISYGCRIFCQTWARLLQSKWGFAAECWLC